MRILSKFSQTYKCFFSTREHLNSSRILSKISQTYHENFVQVFSNLQVFFFHKRTLKLSKNFVQAFSNLRWEFCPSFLKITSVFHSQENTQTLAHKFIEIIQLKYKLSIKSRYEWNNSTLRTKEIFRECRVLSSLMINPCI